jgi:glycosyltransferase involved in cell wall biosynthesis
MRSILIVAYHFPPLRGSSGIQRALRFAQYLPEFGWRPVVLTVTANAYEQSDPATLADIPPGCEVHRAWAVDTARHLAWRKRYIGAWARPDRWVSWWPAGTLAAVHLARRQRFDALLSTYPIATAHLIGASVARLTGIPWVADFRDPMAQDGYPSDPKTWNAYRRIEARAANEASLLTFTTRGALDRYRRLFPSTPADRFALIENGFDEDSFAHARPAPREAGRLFFLHSGIVYPSERDPTHLFEALGQLKASGALDARRAVFRFRASANDAMLAELARRFEVTDLVELCGALPYRDALAEMLSADALLILQASNCNAQIPAKLYEYLRADRPIVALTDPAGDTAECLRRWGWRAQAPLDDAQRIAELLAQFAAGEWHARGPSTMTIDEGSRRGRTKSLSAYLERIDRHGNRS